jgi:hypothetical protein
MQVIHRFGSVDEYEASVCWRMVRDGWLNRHPDARCFVCGDVGTASPVTQRPTGLELHHLSYRGYLGFEPVGASNGWDVRDQLVPLCPPHHYEVERRIRTGTPRASAHIAYRDEYAARAGGRLRHVASEMSEV